MMTRDAKIGLLVALAFILIVGILLSEHITTTTAPEQAELAIAGDRVRQATHAPVPAPVALPKPTIDANFNPNMTVTTRDLLDAPQPQPAQPTARIELGQPAGGQIQVIRVDAPQPAKLPPDPIADAIGVPAKTTTPAPANTQLATNTPTNTTVTPAPTATPTDSRVPASLANAAKQNGMEIVPVDTKPSNASATATVATNTPVPNGARVKEYVAQAGDSLSKIASKNFGRSTPATCDAIVALNASLQKDRNHIVAGTTYLIPADAWAAVLRTDESAAAATPSNAPVASLTKPATAAPTTAAPAATADKPVATVLYTVKAGDSLWGIASREVGTRGAVAQIKQLNPDLFPAGSDTVKVGTQLKLPAKAVGSKS